MVKLLEKIDSFCYSVGLWLDDFRWRIQRIFRGYADIDIWNFDYRLFTLIKRHVEVLRKHTYSYPHTLNSIYEWYDILDDILFACDMYTSENGGDLYDIDEEGYKKYRSIMYDAYKKHHSDGEEFNYPSWDDVQRMQRGIRYFKEYMFHLWV